MRTKLVESDLVDCVIGLGPNLFYNSPMEACIIICRTEKETAKRGKVLFINAVNEVTRKNAQSYLEDSHIDHIAAAYRNYADEENYAAVVDIEEIKSHDYSLNISLYARAGLLIDRVTPVEEAANNWFSQCLNIRKQTDALLTMLRREDEPCQE